jgi:hypothetical protein
MSGDPQQVEEEAVEIEVERKASEDRGTLFGVVVAPRPARSNGTLGSRCLGVRQSAALGARLLRATTTSSSAGRASPA